MADRGTIRFLRRGQVVELGPVAPMATVLDYLRLEERSRGTKDRKSTRLNSSHVSESRMPSSA